MAVDTPVIPASSLVAVIESSILFFPHSSQFSALIVLLTFSLFVLYGSAPAGADDYDGEKKSWERLKDRETETRSEYTAKQNKRPGVRVQIFFSKGELTWEGFLISRYWARKLILLTGCLVFFLFFSRLLFFFSIFFFELAGLLLRALSNSKPFDVGYEAGSGNMACFVHVALLCEFGCGCLQHHSLWSLSAPGQDG